MEAQGIAVAFLPTRGARACRSLPTFESALTRRNRLLQHRIDVVVGPEQKRIEHAHLQAAICGHFLQTSQREIVHMVGVAYAAPPSTNDAPVNTAEVRHSHKDTAFIGETRADSCSTAFGATSCSRNDRSTIPLKYPVWNWPIPFKAGACTAHPPLPLI